MKMPKISVILTLYNTKKYLRESIESVLNQTFKDFELIIVDDCSPDNSLSIAKEYRKKDKRIKIIQNKKNVGVAEAINKGLKIAQGKYIAILDSDDVALPRRLELEYNFLEKNKDIFLVGGRMLVITEDGKKIGKGRIETNTQKIMNDFPEKHYFCHPSVMYRNEKGIRYRKKFYSNLDRDFYLRLCSQGKIMTNIRDVVVKYRMRDTSQTFRSDFNQKKLALKANEFFYERQKTGKDSYNSFNPNKYLKSEFNEEEMRKIIYSKIFGDYYSLNFKLLREHYRLYKEKYGFDYTLFFLFILPFFGKRFNIFLRRISVFMLDLKYYITNLF
jgi:glycosyltransferase involved in cell wall biosynthesis